MHLWLVVLGLCALSSAAPQNWPYRDSLMPYRYGYPGQSQYKYLPEVEDDEDTGPYLSRLHGRQDLVVGSEGDRVKPTSEPGVSVIETGSVAPVVEPAKYTKAPPQASPTHKPVGVDTGRPVQPPPFPAARPPPTPQPTKKPEEDEEDDESEEDADDDVPDHEHDADDDVDGDDNDGDADEDGDDDDEEEERRRQEPLNIKSEKPEAPAAVAAAVPVVPSTVAPVVPANSSAVVVNATKPVVAEAEDVSSEEQDLPQGIEALVPGYVTDQGEVLVPVDTVTGDQPIAIVPDPYGQPTRGVPIQNRRVPSYRGPYEESDDYESPYYFSDIYGGLRRQEYYDEADADLDVVKPTKGHGKPSAVPVDEKDKVSSVESVDEQETDDEDVVSENEGSPKDPESLEQELEGRNEFMSAFPPSRSPELFAYINSRIPVDQSSEYGYDDYVQPSSGEYNGPYAHTPAPYAYRPQIRRQQPRPVYYYRPKPQQSPSVTLALAVNGNQQQQGFTQVPYNRFAGQQQAYSQNHYGSYEDSSESYSYRPVPSPFYRRPVPSQSFYRPNPFSGYQQGPGPVAYRPNQFSGYQYQPQPQYGGYGHRPFVGYRPRPQVVRPVAYGQGNKQSAAVGYLRPTAVRITPLRRPTPVIKLKKNPVDSSSQQSFENPYGFPVDSSVEPNSSGAQDSYEVPQHVIGRKVVGKTASVVKTRRAAKMAKKPSKKLLESKKATSDPDPLNILKKINTHAKRS